MRVNCPHCHNGVEIVAESSLTEIDCPSCGSSFNLLGDQETLTGSQRPAKALGRFELIQKVGIGAFGSVWRAKDSQLDRHVAIKIPRNENLDAFESEKFIREARAVAQLNHPNIVSVHEVGRQDNTIYIVSDFVEGVTLADYLTARQLTAKESAELCTKIADGLHHAHEQGVIHRDLKPSNIMMDSADEPHIMDFGLAKREVGEITMTVDGQVLGTPAYMSPEQAKGEASRVNRQTDIYSLGALLYELLTGEQPFRGNSRMILYQVINDDALAPRKLNGNIPKDLDTICLKCLEKEPRKRYETAEALRQELNRYIDGSPITARRSTKSERIWRWCRRNPWATATLSIVLLVAIASPIFSVAQFRLAHRLDQANSTLRFEKTKATENARQALLLAKELRIHAANLHVNRIKKREAIEFDIKQLVSAYLNMLAAELALRLDTDKQVLLQKYISIFEEIKISRASQTGSDDLGNDENLIISNELLKLKLRLNESILTTLRSQSGKEPSSIKAEIEDIKNNRLKICKDLLETRESQEDIGDQILIVAEANIEFLQATLDANPDQASWEKTLDRVLGKVRIYENLLLEGMEFGLDETVEFLICRILRIEAEVKFEKKRSIPHLLIELDETSSALEAYLLSGSPIPIDDFLLATKRIYEIRMRLTNEPQARVAAAEQQFKLFRILELRLTDAEPETITNLDERQLLCKSARIESQIMFLEEALLTGSLVDLGSIDNESLEGVLTMKVSTPTRSVPFYVSYFVDVDGREFSPYRWAPSEIDPYNENGIKEVIHQDPRFEMGRYNIYYYARSGQIEFKEGFDKSDQF